MVDDPEVVEQRNNVKATIARAESEVQQDRLWRAKEILQGAIPTFGYSPPLFAKYGEVLLRLGDNVQAGKYLFLSGERKTEYEPAINLYLQRHGSGDVERLLRSFPGVARRSSLDEYPEAVAVYLREQGATPERHFARPESATGTSIWSQHWLLMGCLATLAIGIILAALGVVFLIQLLLRAG